MTLKTPVLPNFLKIVLFSAAASMSVSAFAGPLGEGETKVGDLKDMTSETDMNLESTQDELKAMLAEDEAAAEEAAEASTELEVSDVVNEAKDTVIPEAE